MDITRLHPEDTATVDELFALWTATRQHDTQDGDHLSRAMLLADLHNTHPDSRFELHVARLDGRIVGLTMVRLPVTDNTHMFNAYAAVAPGHRRRGIGTALLDHATRIGKTNDRRIQTSNAAETLPGGTKCSHDGRDFLLSKGFTIAHTGRLRKVELAAIEGRIEQDLLDESWPKAKGYELVQWTGATPAEQLPGAAALASRLMSDVPFGDLDLEEVHYDSERYRDAEAAEIARGVEFVCTYIRHIDSGELVAHSIIGVITDSPQYGGQWITLVHPDHRGHRLGMIVKIENHRLLRRTRPEVRWIETSNAEVNSHMVAINERLGFTEVNRHLDFQREI